MSALNRVNGCVRAHQQSETSLSNKTRVPLNGHNCSCVSFPAMPNCCRLCGQHHPDVVCSPHHAQLCAVAGVLSPASCCAAVLLDQLLPWRYKQCQVYVVNVWFGSQHVLQQLYWSDVWKVAGDLNSSFCVCNLVQICWVLCCQFSFRFQYQCNISV